MSSENAVQPRKTFVKSILAAVVGNGLEWFDYGLYAAFATIISANFFAASENSLSALMYTFIVFGVGFVMRPVGGLFFGSLADRKGRKVSLAITILIMGISTTAMGCLPTYETAGVAAPVMLALCRLLQGFATGGEWGSCASFLSEYAGKHNRAYILAWSSSSIGIGLLAGMLSGTLLASLLGEDDLYSWGWRVPFLFGILIAFYGSFLRKSLEETPAFQKQQAENEVTVSPLKYALTNHHRDILKVFFLVAGTSVAYWILLTYMSTYIINFLNISIGTAFEINSVILIFFIIACPLFGKLVDKVGRKPVAWVSYGGMLVCYYPAFYMINHTQSIWVIILVLAVISLLNAALNAVAIPIYTEIFPTKVRASCYAISYNCAQALFGGMAPYVATWLIATTGNSMSIVGYLMITMGLAVVALFFTPETKNREM